jgi:hypothetical protein
MRIPHKVKNEVVKGLSPLEKINAAEFGDRNDELHQRARKVLALAYHGLYLKQCKHKLPRNNHASVEKHYRLGVRLLLVELWDAMKPKNKNGDFFRAFADEIDHDGKSVDPLRAYIGAQVEAAKAFNKPISTPRDFKRDIRAMRIPGSEKTIERVCKEFGSTGKPGRPRKS